LLGGTLAKVLFPAFSKIKDNKIALKEIFLLCAFANSLFSFPLTVFFVLNGEAIILLILGDQWNEAVLPFQILITTLYFRVGYKFIDPLINATGNPAIKAKIQFVYCVLVVIGSLLGTMFGLIHV